MNIGLMHIPHFVSRCKGEAGLIEEYPFEYVKSARFPLEKRKVSNTAFGAGGGADLDFVRPLIWGVRKKTLAVGYAWLEWRDQRRAYCFSGILIH
jgi:hypothetical protein